MQQCCIRPEDFIIHKPINRNQAGNYYIEGFATGQTLHDGRSLQIMKKLVAVATQNSEKDCKVPFSNLATADDKREYNTMQYWLENQCLFPMEQSTKFTVCPTLFVFFYIEHARFINM